MYYSPLLLKQSSMNTVIIVNAIAYDLYLFISTCLIVLYLVALLKYVTFIFVYPCFCFLGYEVGLSARFNDYIARPFPHVLIIAHSA